MRGHYWQNVFVQIKNVFVQNENVFVQIRNLFVQSRNVFVQIRNVFVQITKYPLSSSQCFRQRRAFPLSALGEGPLLAAPDCRPTNTMICFKRRFEREQNHKQPMHCNDLEVFWNLTTCHVKQACMASGFKKAPSKRMHNKKAQSSSANHIRRQLVCAMCANCMMLMAYGLCSTSCAWFG